jgi:hypothetical protein
MYTKPNQIHTQTNRKMPCVLTTVSHSLADGRSNSRFSRPFFAFSHMSDPSESSRFQVLFQSALQDYERQTGTILAREPLAEQVERCNSLESVVNVLQGQARAFGEFQGGESRVMRSLKCVVSVLYSLSTSTMLGAVIGLVRRKVLMGTPLP